MMGNTERGAVDLEWDHLSNEVRHFEPSVLLGTKRHWETQSDVPREVMPWPLAMYKTTTRSPESWETDRDEFFGHYHDFHNPKALKQDTLGENEVKGGNAMGAFDWSVTLEAGESTDWSCVLGVLPREEVSAADWEQFQSQDYVKGAYERTLTYWDERLSKVNVSFPDRDLEHLVNTWLPYQVTINTWFGRAPSYWHSSQGYTGFRDACHEAFGISPVDPEDARDKLLHILEFTYESGLNSHRTPRGARDYDESNNADDPLWVPFAIHSYLRETGDWEFLEQEVGYLDSDETASVLDHMIEGIDYVLTQRGEKGLPLIRYGDWNDALNTLGEEGKGESVWIGQFLYGSLLQAADIIEEAGRTDKADHYREEAERVQEVLEEECWDGDWYLRAFTDEGDPVGSHRNDEGQIYLNTQSWAALTGVGDDQRVEQALDSVIERLDTKWGYQFFAPAYEEIDPEIGVITQFVPGKKENASIFSHACAFAIFALGKIGRRSDASELWRKISPTTHAKTEPDRYQLEPYVYCQNVTGPSSSDFGEGNYHWLSGTASWVYRSVLDQIIGLQPRFDGMEINPSLPPNWESVELSRDHRGTTWHLEINQDPEGDGQIESITVNGETVDETVIPYTDDDTVDVEVYLS
jgi:cellobiose phosphorylase